MVIPRTDMHMQLIYKLLMCNICDVFVDIYHVIPVYIYNCIIMYVTIFEIYHLKLFYIMQYIIWNKIDSNNLPVYNTASWYDSITYNVYHYRVCMWDTISYHIIWCNTILHNMKYLFVSYDIISFCTVLNDTISHYMIQYCIV